MKIEWNKSNRFSLILAIIIYVGTFALGFYLGQMRGCADAVLNQSLEENIINDVIFDCEDNKNIHAIFFQNKVELYLSDGRNFLLHQTISASGARYANEDESFVFWNKGDTAFIQEDGVSTYNNCVIK